MNERHPFKWSVSLRVAALGAALALPLGVPATSPAEGPRLVVEPVRLDFGKRGHNEQAMGELTVRNGGTGVLEITTIKQSCSCIRFTPSRVEPLAPGESRVVQVTMSSGRAVGRIDKKITFETNDPRARSLSVPVGMSVLEEYSMSARELRFTGIVGGAAKTASLDVTRRRPGGKPVAVKVKQFDIRFGATKAEHLTATVTPVPNGQRVTVELAPTHPEGRIFAELIADVDGRQLVVPIAGHMFAYILVEPVFVAFSGVKDGDPTTSTQEVRLTSTDETPFSVTAVEPAPSRGKALPIELVSEVNAAPSNLAHRITLKVVARPDRPAGQAPFSGKLLIRTDHPKKPLVEVSYSGFFAAR